MTGDDYYTPPEIARKIGTQPENVVGWIRAGMLEAVNIALPTSKKPRYKISVESLDKFLAARAVTPPTPKTRSRRSKEQIPQYV